MKRSLLVMLSTLALSGVCYAQTDTALRVEKVNGIARRLPLDTLIIGGQRIIGCAVPSRAFYLHGDMNLDGQVGLADVIQLARKVLMDAPMPSADTISIQVTRIIGKDTTLFTFLPQRAGKR